MVLSKFDFPKGREKYYSRYCRILSTSSYLPERVIHNEEIISQGRLSLKNKVIIKTIGVETRHIADDKHDDSDVLSLSARPCLEESGITPDQLSRIIVNKYAGDNFLPMTASRLQEKLGSTTAVHAFDIDGGITSFLHAFDTASRFIDTGDEYILLSSGGIHNKLVSKTDPRVAFLFGDASASILLGFSEKPHILSSYFFSNHQYYELATALYFSSHANETHKNENDGLISLLLDSYQLNNWKLAEDFYRQATLEIAKNNLAESGLTMNDLDLVLVTENNRKIRELTLDALGVSENRSLSLLRECGNTMSAMLPLLLDYGFKSGRIEPGMNILIISHGEGYSGGGLIYKV